MKFLKLEQNLNQDNNLHNYNNKSCIQIFLEKNSIPVCKIQKFDQESPPTHKTRLHTTKNNLPTP